MPKYVPVAVIAGIAVALLVLVIGKVRENAAAAVEATE